MYVSRRAKQESPFAALFSALCETFPEHAVSPFLIEQEKEGFIASITKYSGGAGEYLRGAAA